MPRTTSTQHTNRDNFRSLTEAGIQGYFDSGSFSRGRSYFRQGRIHDPRLREQTIEALCVGSRASPYRVTAILPLASTPKAGLSTECSCPIGGGCKHAVALLLTWIADPGRFVEAESLKQRISQYSHPELMAIVERMIRQNPSLEQVLDLVPPAVDADKPLDPERLRRLVRASLRSFTEYEFEWGVYPQVSPELENLIEIGRQQVESGRHGQAIALFDVIDEQVEAIFFEIQDDEGSLGGVLDACDEALTSILVAQADLPDDKRLDPADRERLIEIGYGIWHLDVFEAGGQDFGGQTIEALADHASEAERTRVECWLDAEPLRDDWTRRAALEVRIMLREHHGLSDEQILQLYLDSELWNEAARFLIEHGRIDEAIAIIIRRVTMPGTFLDLANALVAHDANLLERALTMVEDHAWEVEKVNPHADAKYRQWLAGMHQKHNRPDRALPLVERQFRQSPSLVTWQEVREVASDAGQPAGTWDRLRPDLLGMLRKEKSWMPLIDIALFEGDVDLALESWDRSQSQSGKSRAYSLYWGSADFEVRLAVAAEAAHPERAIAIYRKISDQQIAMRSRQNYAVAAEYLARVKRLLVRNDRESEWRTLIDEIRTTNKSLRALREELDVLGLN